MGKKLAVMGDLTVDFIGGLLADIPAWGKEVEIERFSRRLGGNAGNFAVAACSLGREVAVAGPIGADADGRWILDELSRFGIDTRHVATTETGGTSVTMALVRNDGERAFITYPGALAALPHFIADAALPAADATLLTGWCQPPRVTADILITRMESLRATGTRLAMDLSWYEASWQDPSAIIAVARRLDVFIMNDLEAMALTGTAEAETALRALRLQISSGPDIVVKCGAHGAIAQGAAGGLCRVAGHRIETTETVGAGDSFNAAFLSARCLDGRSLDASVAEAVRFAGETLRLGRAQSPGDRRSAAQLQEGSA